MLSKNIKIPDYVEDEIKKYICKKEKGKGTISTYDNILALIRLAVVNNRITEKEAEKIKQIIKKL